MSVSSHCVLIISDYENHSGCSFSFTFMLIGKTSSHTQGRNLKMLHCLADSIAVLESFSIIVSISMNIQKLLQLGMLFE